MGKAATDQDSRERYEAFLRNSQEGIWRAELDKPISIDLPPEKQIKLMYKYGYMAEANLAMAKMYGFRSVKPLVGLRLGELLIESDPANHDYLLRFIMSKYKLSGVESHELDRYGEPRFFRNSLVGIIENGQLVRAWGTQQDVTDQHKAMQEKMRSEDRLRLALQASKMGIWEWNLETDELYWSYELKVIFGLKTKDKIDYEMYLSMLHPDDRGMMQSVISKALKNGKNYQVEHRIIARNGQHHWLLGQGRAIKRGGKTVRMIGTSMIIDERKKFEQERVELLELSNVKDEFISIASHQLRTPATGVKQYVSMVLDGFAGEINEEQQSMLKMAYESNERQINIINDLLKVANIDAGKVNLMSEKRDLIGLLKEVVEEQKNKFDQRRQKLSLLVPAGKILLLHDRRLLRMVLENLLDNASKYSPEKAKVNVQVKDRAEHVIINVRDTGIGIDKIDQSKLFQKFSRIQNHLTTGIDGTGLGLYWSKKIIDLHSGTISVQSRVGAGTTFCIQLPKLSSKGLKKQG